MPQSDKISESQKNSIEKILESMKYISITLCGILFVIALVLFLIWQLNRKINLHDRKLFEKIPSEDQNYYTLTEIKNKLDELENRLFKKAIPFSNQESKFYGDANLKPGFLEKVFSTIDRLLWNLFPDCDLYNCHYYEKATGKKYKTNGLSGKKRFSECNKRCGYVTPELSDEQRTTKKIAIEYDILPNLTSQIKELKEITTKLKDKIPNEQNLITIDNVKFFMEEYFTERKDWIIDQITDQIRTRLETIEITPKPSEISTIEKDRGIKEVLETKDQLYKSIVENFTILYEEVEDIRKTQLIFLKEGTTIFNFDNLYQGFKELPYKKGKIGKSDYDIESLLFEYFSPFFCIYAEIKFKERHLKVAFLPEFLVKLENVKKAMVNFLKEMDYKPLEINLGTTGANERLHSPKWTRSDDRFGKNIIVSVSKWGYEKLSTGEIIRAEVTVNQ